MGSWARGSGVRFGRTALAVVVLLCGLTLVGGFVNKDRCTGPMFDQWGRSEPDYKERTERDVCYSDIQHLWIGRDIDRHVFPYVDGGITDEGQLVGGTVEYPVLTGVLIWAGALFTDTDAGFLLGTALLLAPFGLVTAWLLGRLSGWRSLLWAIGPPLVLYAFHNWDLPVVACAVAAVYVVHRGWGRAGADRPLLDRAVAGSVLLAIGFTFKLYPALFVLPLMLYVLTGGPGGRELPAGRRWDVAGAAKVAFVAIATVVLVNLPFALAGFAGWRASFTFQGLRQADITTNSIWYWGSRPFIHSDADEAAFQATVSLLSPLLVFASFALACWLGWLRYRHTGSYPWIQVSAAMLCGFLLLHKVHSPQYTLWLVPMLVLLRVRMGWVIAYFVADLAMGIGIFRWYWAIEYGGATGIYDSFSAQAVMIGVWGRAALLVGLFFAFLTARSTVTDPPPPVPAGALAR
ncbi:glycosyltransferase family 87 protein [Goodfellowiella coeruleoviolacea]|uniref:glycosyltransferase family 87 protein n=1 Tax=Goodfellowiella coeruleoviolacea TaxID=334858 RepID=UPI0038990442